MIVVIEFFSHLVGGTKVLRIHRRCQIDKCIPVHTKDSLTQHVANALAAQ